MKEVKLKKEVKPKKESFLANIFNILFFILFLFSIAYLVGLSLYHLGLFLESLEGFEANLASVLSTLILIFFIHKVFILFKKF